MARKKKRDYEQAITPYMERIDENLLRIYKELATIKEMQKHLIQRYDELEARIQVLRNHLIDDEIKLDKIVKIMTAKKKNKLSRIKHFLRKYLGFL